MKLIKFKDYEGVEHYVNEDYIISIRPFDSFPGANRIRRSKVEYGSGFVDAIYMKERASEVVNHIALSTMPRRSTI